MKAMPTTLGPDALTKREIEVLTLIAKGYTRPEVAAIVGVAESTVVTYTKFIYAKLDVDSRAEAAVRACEMGLHGTPAALSQDLPEAYVARLLAECDHEPGTHVDAATLMRFANRLAGEVRAAEKARGAA